MVSRRKFVRNATVIPAAISALHAKMYGNNLPIPEILEDVTTDEDFWHQVKMAYTVSPTLVNLNNGGVCPQPRVVQDAVERYNQLSNETPSYYMWRILDDGRETIRQKLAQIGGCSADEIAVNRNASEALETVIFGLRLERGDEVVLTKQDYPNMINAWKQRAHRDGIVLRWIDLDLPSEDADAITKAYVEAFTDRTRVVHITHVINWIGQVIPARKIADAAHERGIDVVIDAAHSFAHLVYDIPDLGGDYLGTSLHKWLCAPFGSGMLWVKKEKIKNLYPLFGSPDPESEDIRKFEHLGTRSFAIEQAIGQAIDFHLMIGAERKFKRLHYLKNYWMNALAETESIEFFTSRNPQFGGGIGFFSIKEIEPGKVGQQLQSKNIHVVPIKWEHFSGIRVTPNVYTLTSDLDRFINAVKEIAANKS
ncbi:MAG: aminotransferase class V-fold PLP-dependent enzyme [Saprospiraceae bacterium]|nr:aminotransferase class V-fold PLP-dependent enzyme [Saprospiraceae bacterium]